MNKSESEELRCIGLYQPVFAGDVLSKATSQTLIDKGLVMRYDGDYVLTELGKEEFKKNFPDLAIGQRISRSYQKGIK
jgi:hypothetical protein